MSKLSWHLQNIPGWAQQVINSEYVKLIDPPSTNLFPGRKVIGRVYIPDEETNAMMAKGAVGVAEWWPRVAPMMLTRKYVWAWCLPNEPQPVSNWNFCNALADFTIEAARVMHSYDLKVLGGELAEGNPGGATDTERANLFCAIARGLAVCDYWSQHAYWVPDGYPHPEAGYNQWHALRYQMNRGYARARGIKLPPVLLTEAGWDYGIVGKPREGWIGKADWSTYFTDLKRFDADLMADLDCLTATPFVSGANLDWWKFEIGEMPSKDLAAYIGQPIVMPPVVPPEVPVSDPRASNCKAFHVSASGMVDGIELVYTPVPSAKYACVSAQLIDEAAAQGNTVVTVDIFDQNGIRTAERALMEWPYGGSPAADSPVGSGNPSNQFATTSKYIPPVIGPLGFMVGDANKNPISDHIWGYGLPGGRHISGYVAFKERGEVVIPPPAVPPTGNLELDIRNLAYNNIGKADGIPYNPTLAFPKEATRLNLGAPLTTELRQLTGYVVQGFALGILYCVDGDWDDINKLSW